MNSPLPLYTPKPEDLCAAVLCGGQGSRMDGADKGLVIFGDRPLVLHALGKLSAHAGHLLINANRNQSIYQGFGCPVVSDRIGGFPGPLAGLDAVLQACQTPLLMTVPCDVPNFPADLPVQLATALTDAKADVAVARHGGELQPAFLLMRCDEASRLRLNEVLKACFDEGRRSLHHWLSRAAQNGLVVVEVDVHAQKNAFANLNTLADIDAAQPQLDIGEDEPETD